MKNVTATLLLLIACFLSASSQDTQIEANLYLRQAQEAYDMKGIEGYDKAYSILKKGIETLGKTNPDLEALKAKTVLAAAKELKNPTLLYLADTSVKKFFKLTNPQNYPLEKYEAMILLKNELADYLAEFGPEYKFLTEKNYINADIPDFFQHFQSKLPKSMLLSGSLVTDISALRSDLQHSMTLNPVYTLRDVIYYGIPFTTGSRPGFLLWNFTLAPEIESWYMCFKDSKQQAKETENEQTDFFMNFKPYKLSQPTETVHTAYIQSSAIQLKANTSYYLWFSGPKQKNPDMKPVSVKAALYLTEDKTADFSPFLEANAQAGRIETRSTTE